MKTDVYVFVASLAIVSATVASGACPNGAKLSVFPRHMPFGRPGQYFSSWRLSTAFLFNNGTYPGGDKERQDTAVTVQVVDQEGNLVSGCPITWETGRGHTNGWVLPVTEGGEVTGTDGTARFSWVAGSAYHQTVAATITSKNGSTVTAAVTGRAAGERKLAGAPHYNFDYGEDWTAIETDAQVVQWPGSAYVTTSSQGTYYGGLQSRGVLFTTWWKSSTDKTEILMPRESQFEWKNNRREFENATHFCHQCTECAEGWHASCFLKHPPVVGIKYRETTTKKFNSWDPQSALTSYSDANGCGPRGANADADLSGCVGGEATVVDSAEGIDGSVVSTIEGCDYYSYTIYQCDDVTFDPSSTLVSYSDKGSCGLRGDDARADLTQCLNGHSVVAHVPNDNWEVVAEIQGCEYVSYTIYECNDVDKFIPNTDIAKYFETVGNYEFNPSSTLVSYSDKGACGPRGDDAKADLTQCPNGHSIVDYKPNVDYKVVAVIDKCEYFSYTVYECDSDVSFNPSSTLVSYSDKGVCGPRGDDAQADLTQCSNGHSIVSHEPNVDYKVVAVIDKCEYFSYTVYECNTVVNARAVSSLPKVLIGEMRHLSDLRGHTAGGFLESPYAVRYSCLDTPTIEIMFNGGRWRGTTGPWQDMNVNTLSLNIDRNNCVNVLAAVSGDGIRMSTGGALIGPSDRVMTSGHCTNGMKDGDEYDVDCGGSCAPCGFDMASCDDGITNGDEEYIDCGGSCPVTCSEKGNAGSYFKVTSDADNNGKPFTWDKAQKLCRKKNSALAIVATPEQNQVLTELCGENTKCWIGLQRRESCQGPSCLKWVPREDGSVFYLDQTIFNHWGCNGGGEGTGCYFQYKEDYTRYYMYSENHSDGKKVNSWWATKKSTMTEVALCGTPPMQLLLPSSSPLPHDHWRVRSDEPWLLDLHFTPFYERDCITPILLGDPITIQVTSSWIQGSLEPIVVHFQDPTPIGCFRLDSSTSYAKDGGVPKLETVSNGEVFLEYSDDGGVTWTGAPVPVVNLLTESDAKPFPCTENKKGKFFVKEKRGTIKWKNCKWLKKKKQKTIERYCEKTISKGGYGIARDVCPKTCGVAGC